MKIKTVVMGLFVTVLLLGLIGCSAAPSADSSDVKGLVFEIFREQTGINDPASRSKSQLELRAIRTVSINEKLQKTIAEAELVVDVINLPQPVVYYIAYSAQYTTDGQLYVTILELR